MATKNDITGDSISSKVFSEQGRLNYDDIFRKNQNLPKLASASWCGPCSAVKAQIAQQGLSVEIVDVDDSPTFTKDHGIKSLPCLVLYNNGGHELIYGTENIIKALQ